MCNKDIVDTDGAKHNPIYVNKGRNFERELTESERNAGERVSDFKFHTVVRVKKG
jgi:hypothetical protein